jgi:hypothetical protein
LCGYEIQGSKLADEELAIEKPCTVHLQPLAKGKFINKDTEIHPEFIPSLPKTLPRIL